MRSKFWLALAATAVLLVAASGWGVWRFMQQGLYSVGEARAQVQAEGSAPTLLAGGEIEVAPGIRLHHVAVGTGPDALVIHGGPGYAPEHPWAAAELLGKSIRLHFYDQRGCGRSTRPLERIDSNNPWDAMKEIEDRLGLATQVADIDRVRRALGLDRVILIGHSFGGLLAALYASEFPARTKALVLVAPANLVVMPKSGSDLFELVAGRLPADRAEAYAQYRDQYFDFPTLVRQDERSLSSFFARFGTFYAQATGSTVSVSEAQAGGFMPLAVYLSLGRKTDFRGALSKVTAPVLVVHGAADLSPVDDSKQFASYFPSSRLEVLPAASHFVYDDNPVAFAETVTRFLSTEGAN